MEQKAFKRKSRNMQIKAQLNFLERKFEKNRVKISAYLRFCG